MVNNTIESWLKAAAGNKITNKNTWNAPLIEHFTNITEYKENKDINFLRATVSLDGCVKVYSARVDDVTDDTLKLLDCLNVEEAEIKQKRQKLRSTTLETNINNITLKEDNTFQVIEPSFYFWKEDISLLRNCNISSKGELLLFEKNEEENYLNLLSYPLEINLYSDKTISPTLNEVDPTITDKFFMIENEEKEDEEKTEENEHVNEMVQEIAEGYEPVQIPVIIENNTFGYTKGWAGPTFWKVRNYKKDEKKEKKKKIKKKINFLEKYDFDTLFKISSCKFSAKELLERKKNKFMMPEDHKFDKNDLYKYMVKEGSFYSTNKLKEPVIEEIFTPSAPLPVISYDNDTPEEVEVDFKNVKNVTLSKKLHLKFRRSQKRIDIGLLQNKIYSFIESKKQTSLKEIFQSLPNFYSERECKDISMQYCMLSLLFLAQEKGIKLEKKNAGELFVNVS
ncbi:chromosome condensation complex Condensin [Tubulinosema ratisbonensis]|uniref:Condensin complex subunit 2 n=1 Tax=Tubulinosema ratisbonensis TaxID=291195 RepID=A0A437AJE5_9MICR|nr:chromosome condensation complex Condensin [Tubulinosema ratisbonensis]